MHKRGKYYKDSKFLMSTNFFFKENRYNQCFHSISIERVSTFDVILIFFGQEAPDSVLEELDIV